MSADIPALPGTIGAATAPSRGRYPTDTRSAKKRGLDGRTTLARRSKQLLKALMERLGEPSDALVVADCRALVELKTLAERERDKLLEKEERTSHELGRIEHLIRHAEGRLGLAPGSADAAPLSMTDRLASLGYALPPDVDDETVDDVENAS